MLDHTCHYPLRTVTRPAKAGIFTLYRCLALSACRCHPAVSLWTPGPVFGRTVLPTQGSLSGLSGFFALATRAVPTAKPARPSAPCRVSLSYSLADVGEGLVTLMVDHPSSLGFRDPDVPSRSLQPSGFGLDAGSLPLAPYPLWNATLRAAITRLSYHRPIALLILHHAMVPRGVLAAWPVVSALRLSTERKPTCPAHVAQLPAPRGPGSSWVFRKTGLSALLRDPCPRRPSSARSGME